MLFNWFDGRHATEVGVILADTFAERSTLQRDRKSKAMHRHSGDPLPGLLQRAAQELGSLRLNFYKKAKLANAFRWRLVENGVEAAVAADVTQKLVTQLSLNKLAPPSVSMPARIDHEPSAQTLLIRARGLTAQGDHAGAVTAYRAFLERYPSHADALNNLGAALCQLGHFKEAEPWLRSAMRIKPKLASAHFNLGTVLRVSGRLPASVQALGRALKLAPKDVEARVSLGSSLFALGRVDDSKDQLQRALKLIPSHLGARLGMGQIAEQEGHFDEAAALYQQILEQAPDSAGALCRMIGLRTMTAADAAWAERLEQILSRGVEPQLEAGLHFALGKYNDDVREFRTAFQHYRRANEVLKANAQGYDRQDHREMVDDLIRVYPSAAVATSASSSSEKPVFVVGMPRSGTSLVEQIIASHPAAFGAGELEFWNSAMRRHEAAARRHPPEEPLKRKLAGAYLHALDRHSADALRVVDKAPINADYLGCIHAVFPRAHVIYVRRDPLDTCLSCYFQPFSAATPFAMDLSDLAHYFEQHHRLMTHWRAVLPRGTVLEVPYEALVSDQERWTRKIIDFLQLDWDSRCLDFHATRRTVATASTWQVRQKIYLSSVGRWRNYGKFIGPLQKLERLADTESTD